MLRNFLFLLILNAPILSQANNLCAQLFLKNPKTTIEEVINKGLFDISEEKMGDLLPHETASIQSIVNSSGLVIFVVGSAAQGQRRAIGSDLPLAIFGGAKKNTKSDIDYVVKAGFGDKASELPLPDLDSSWGVREVDYLNLSNSPVIIFRPQSIPLLLRGFGKVYLD